MIVAVAIILVRGERVLGMRRSATRDAAPGLWETVSGRVEPGDEPFATACRELREETGLEHGVHVTIEPSPVDAYAAKRRDEDMIVVVYRASCREGFRDDEVVRSGEHSEHAWLTPDELEARGSPVKLVRAVRAAIAR